MKRRTVHKISPSQASSFDQQFWPVLVALTVLGGIALGAVLTIMRGPWMWGSLLVLPLLAAFAVFLLFNLDNNRLRRSLQFAIITSLALHLLVLVFASVLNIFQNPYKPNEKQVAQRPVRTIEISDQRAAFVWEETNARETPEPEVETKREVQPTTNVQPQPIPVEETKPQVNPQLVRRETNAKSVPRQNRELSKLRRQTKNLQPQSSQQVTGQKKVAENKTSPEASTKKTEAESSKKADSIAKQSTPSKEPVSEPQKDSASPSATTRPVVAKSDSSPRRTEESQTPTQVLPKPTPSIARVSRAKPNLPKQTKKAPVTEKVAASAAAQPKQTEPSKSASELTRRPTESRTVRPAFTNKPRSKLSPKSQIAKIVERTPQPQSLPSIANPTSVTITPRRSTTESAVVTSPIQVENPDRAPESKTTSRELNSKTLSVTRSTEGIAGVGRSKNLDRFTGGMNSPASRASDSAKRERTQSTATDPRMLTSSQKSIVRRSVGATRMPTSAFKAETSSAAKIAGTKSPKDTSIESAAATLDSASSNHRDEVSAERGSASVDLGPTKIVTDRQTQRRSGGGQPEVSQLNPESTRRSRDRSNNQPSLVASSVADVAAPRNSSAAPPSTNGLEASNKSVFAARAGGESATTVERWSAKDTGELADMGQSNLANQLSESRERAQRASDESGWEEDDDEDEDEKNRRGNSRTRVAVAPITKSDPGFGTGQTDATSNVAATKPGDGVSESLATKISRQATASIPGSGLGRTATNALLQAATSLPIIEASPSPRSGSGKSKTAEPSTTSGIATNPKPRGSRSTSSNVAPSIAGKATVESPVVASSGTAEMSKLDSLPVSISKSDLESMEQIQGMELEIDAIEGPAGLGTRPDNFIGVMTRPASRDSEQLLPDMKNRFRSKRFGGAPAVNPDAVIAKEAFRNRAPSAMSAAAEPSTEAAIHLGLEFLARYQSPDGSWALTGFDRDEPQHLSQLDSDTAATGLALLAFQGAGYNHREFKYARQIDHAIQWLIENQAEDGGLYVSSDKKSDDACRMYSHGIAALALTEAYGMTQDPRLREPAQKALDYIAKTQDPRKGGWRYFDRPSMLSADTSVTGWMMMALQSGRLAGLKTKQDSFRSIDDWLDVSADPENKARYRYNPYAKDSKGVSRMQGRKPTASMTSVGLLMRIYSGWDKDDPRLLAGADFLLDQQLPNDSTPQLRDTYYWYYATQVLKHVDGPRWERWNEKLRPLLTRSQQKTGDMAGSWHPYRPVPDRWGAFGGRLYVTTMNLLSLEVRHRMLPLYQDKKTPSNSAPVIEGTVEPIDGATENISTGIISEPNADMEAARIDRPANRPENISAIEKPVTVAPSADIAKAEKIDVDAPDKLKLPKPNRDLDVARNKPAEPKRTRTPTRPKPVPAKAKPENKPDPKVAKTEQPAELEPKIEIEKPKLAAAAPEINKPSIDLSPAAMPDDDIEPRIRVKPRDIAKAKPNSLAGGDQPNRKRTRPSNLQPTVKLKTMEPKTKVNPKPIEPKPKPVEPKKATPTIKYAAVAGLVSLDGKPIKNARVKFTATDNSGATITARTDQRGRFNIPKGSARQPGLPTGKYKLQITTFYESPNEDVIDFLELIPAKYNSETILQATISADKNNALKFDLKSD